MTTWWHKDKSGKYVKSDAPPERQDAKPAPTAKPKKG